MRWKEGIWFVGEGLAWDVVGRRESLVAFFMEIVSFYRMWSE
jgi:hypothetical protein